MTVESYKQYPPYPLDIHAVQEAIRRDQGEILWRQDFKQLGEKVFDYDIYKHGPEADRDLMGVAFRQLHKVDNPARHEHLSQPDAGHYDITADGLRLRLKPEETELDSYSTSEWAAGPCHHLDQHALVKGMLDNDPRVIVPGRSVTWRIRLSPGYAEGTALGTFGMIAQDFRGHEDPGKKFYDYSVMSIVYIGPSGKTFGRLLWKGSKPRLAVVVAEYSLGMFWTRPLPYEIDVSQWHDYTIEPWLGGVRFRVDGEMVVEFRQGSRSLNLDLIGKGRLGLPFRRGFILPGPTQPDAWVDNNTASSPRISGFDKFQQTQSADIAWVETRRLPIKTWCIDSSFDWPYYQPGE